MRSSRQETERRRERIIETAARLFREKGVDGVSVPEIMQAVGMTHGGFYKHFASKEELAAAAYGKAFEQTVARLDKAAGKHGDDRAAAWEALIASYLSPAHRDNPGAGCATTALATDTARDAGGKSVHAAFESGVTAMLEHVGRLIGQPADSPEAMAALSTMVGALLLSRSSSARRSDAFLAAGRDHLKPNR